MNISFKPQHLKRYKDIALLFLKYGNADVVQQIGLRAALAEEDLRDQKKPGAPSSSEDLGKELAADLEAMGPAYVKLGQLLSSRADILPPAYLKALSRLQDNVKPFSFTEVETIVTEELGVRLSKAFSFFSPEPLAAASLGQVHRANLRDGRAVVVKVQRPGIRGQIAQDLEVVDEIISFLEEHTKFGQRYQLHKVFDEFEKNLIYELDYLRESSNMTVIAGNLTEFPQVFVPKPIADYTTRSVLTMEFVTGKKVTSIQPLERMELPGAMLADQLFQAYLKQILVDGIFHADPHPGNIFLTDDHRVALLDLGMVGRVTPVLQENLLKMLISISEGKGEDAADLAKRMSETTPEFNEPEFRRKIASLVAEQQDLNLDRMDLGAALLHVCRAAGENGLFVPTELTMLGKTLLQLDEVGKSLDPNFNPNAAVREHVTEILNKKVKKEATSGKLLSSILEMKDFVGGLPTRLNRILDVVGGSDLEVKVRLTDVNALMEGFQKIANRITTGLVLAALIVGAALLMQVQTPFTLFGYPGLAIICFLVAAGGGFWLVFNILFSDQKSKKKQQRLTRQ